MEQGYGLLPPPGAIRLMAAQAVPRSRFAISRSDQQAASGRGQQPLASALTHKGDIFCSFCISVTG